MIREAPDAVPIPAGDRSIEFDAVSFSYPAPPTSRCPRWRRCRCPSTAGRRRSCTTSSFRVEPGQLVALVGHPAPASRRSPTWCRGSTTSPTARSGSAASTSGTATLDSLRDTIGVVSQDAHLFHDTIRANLLYARPDATDEQLWAALRRRADRGADRVAARRAGHRRRRPRLPALRRREAAAGDRPACCSRRPAIVILDEATAHLDSESEVGGAARAGHRAGRPDVAGDRAPAVDHPRAPTRSSSSMAVASWSRGTHERVAGARGRYAELYRTQFADGERRTLGVA